MYTQKYIFTYIHTHISMCMYICTYVRPTNIYIYTYTYTYVFYVSVCTYLDRNTHTVYMYDIHIINICGRVIFSIQDLIPKKLENIC